MCLYMLRDAYYYMKLVYCFVYNTNCRIIFLNYLKHFAVGVAVETV
jgi:hypothetical protein